MQPRDWLRTRQNWFFRLHFLVDEGRKVEKSFSTIRRSPRLPDSSSADLLFFYPCTSSTFYKLNWGDFKSLTLLLNLLLSFEVMLNSSEILWSFWKPFKRWLHISLNFNLQFNDFFLTVFFLFRQCMLNARKCFMNATDCKEHLACYEQKTACWQVAKKEQKPFMKRPSPKMVRNNLRFLRSLLTFLSMK